MSILSEFGVPTSNGNGILKPYSPFKSKSNFDIQLFDKDENEVFLEQQITSCELKVDNGSAKLFYEVKLLSKQTLKDLLNELNQIHKYVINFKDDLNVIVDSIEVLENSLLNYSLNLNQTNDFTSFNPVVLHVNLNVILQ